MAALWEAFQGGRLTADESFESLLQQADPQIARAYEVAQAVVRLARNQILLEARLDAHERRLEDPEATLGNNGHHISPAQAISISQAVNAIALELGKKSRRNESGGVYERTQGWQPEDVSGENHGFDVHSLCYDDGALTRVRYIEVKASAQSGAIRLSANEWKKARRYGDQFWLYIVTHAATNSPRIRVPAGAFAMDEDIFATGFIVPEESWRNVS